MFALLSFIGKDLIGSILLFPLWWYGAGFKGLLDWMRSELSFRWRSYAIALWLKNMFVPMYGEYDIWGRIISIIVRIAVVVGRLIGIVVEILVYILFALIWLIAPVACLFLFLMSFASSALLSALR